MTDRETIERGVRGVVAFIGIGSNLGNPVGACRDAICRLSCAPHVRVLRCSSLYRTEPVGPQDQPWFINAVAEVLTTRAPRGLFEVLKGIERGMGRTASERWGPRLIDLDLLLYGQEVMTEPDLQIPHPELHRRRFVLAPLCEIAPYAIHPAFGISVRGLMERLVDDSTVELFEPEKSGRSGVEKREADPGVDGDGN